MKFSASLIFFLFLSIVSRGQIIGDTVDWKSIENKINFQIQQNNLNQSLRTLDSAMLLSRRHNNAERLKGFLLKVSMVHSQLGNSERALSYLRMFELEVENSRNKQYEEEREIIFKELARLYQRYSEDSVVISDLQQNQSRITKKDQTIVLWLKILLSVLLVMTGIVIYLMITNRRKITEPTPVVSSFNPEVKTEIETSKTSQWNSQLSKALKNQIDHLSEVEISKELKSGYFLTMEDDEIVKSICFTIKKDSRVVLIGFFSLQATQPEESVILFHVVDVIQEVLKRKADSLTMLMTLLDQRLQSVLNDEKLNPSGSSLLGGFIEFNKYEKSLVAVLAGIPVITVGKEGQQLFLKNSAPIGDNTFKNQYYQTIEMNLMVNDSIYCVSPGFYSQVGGTSNKPIGIDSFTELLKTIHKDSTDNQEFMIRKVYREWKGNNKHTDTASLISWKA